MSRALCHRCDVNDLPTLDAELYRNLMHLRDYQGDAADLALTFTVADSALGVHREVKPLSLRGHTALLWAAAACAGCVHALSPDFCSVSALSRKLAKALHRV